eukprot:356273-Chlamydomonas_euryale.AAC.1
MSPRQATLCTQRCTTLPLVPRRRCRDIRAAPSVPRNRCCAIGAAQSFLRNLCRAAGVAQLEPCHLCRAIFAALKLPRNPLPLSRCVHVAQAGDPVRAAAAEAQHLRTEAAKSESTSERRVLLADAAAAFLAALAGAAEAEAAEAGSKRAAEGAGGEDDDVGGTARVAARTRRRWALLAAKSLQEAGGPHVRPAALLYIRLRRFRLAHELLSALKDRRAAAECCVTAWRMLSGSALAAERAAGDARLDAEVAAAAAASDAGRTSAGGVDGGEGAPGTRGGGGGTTGARLLDMLGGAAAAAAELREAADRASAAAESSARKAGFWLGRAARGLADVGCHGDALRVLGEGTLWARQRLGARARHTSRACEWPASKNVLASARRTDVGTSSSEAVRDELLALLAACWPELAGGDTLQRLALRAADAGAADAAAAAVPLLRDGRER